MKLAAATVGSRDAGLALELSSRKPDLTFSAGFRRLSLDNSQVWVAGVSIPLTIFDKRQGAVAEARMLVRELISPARFGIASGSLYQSPPPEYFNLAIWSWALATPHRSMATRNILAGRQV